MPCQPRSWFFEASETLPIAPYRSKMTWTYQAPPRNSFVLPQAQPQGCSRQADAYTAGRFFPADRVSTLRPRSPAPRAASRTDRISATDRVPKWDEIKNRRSTLEYVHVIDDASDALGIEDIRDLPGDAGPFWSDTGRIPCERSYGVTATERFGDNPLSDGAARTKNPNVHVSRSLCRLLTTRAIA